jgi:hypothetical protein
MKSAYLMLVAIAAVLVPVLSRAQAHGPTAQEVQANGQDIPGARERRQQIWAERAQLAVAEQQASLDETTRTARLAELDTWLRRLPGRFRIDGRIDLLMQPNAVRTRDFDGVADCKEIGDGVGLHCILNAKWPVIEDQPSMVAMGPTPKKTPSAQLDTMQPAVLVLGLDLGRPGIRAMMVNADSIAHTWSGPLRENTARADRLNRCLQSMCLQPLELIAEPDSRDIAIVLHSGRLTITLTMIRDADARAEKPIKGMKSH